MDRHNPDGSLRAEHYDPRILADHTGTTFQGKPRNAREGQRMIQQLMSDPQKLQCPKCWGDTWVIIADNHPTTGLMALVCANPRCGAVVPPIEAHKPQLQDATAKRLGLWTPGQMVNMGDDD
jgi:hypothetical protein